MSEQRTIHILVASSNRGRYALDDPEHGHDLTAGEPVEVRLGGTFIRGRVEYSRSAPRAHGLYSISSSGTRAAESLTEETFTRRVQTEIWAGKDLADALDAVSGKVSDLFTGYYFLCDDGSCCGLCTGMQVRLLT